VTIGKSVLVISALLLSGHAYGQTVCFLDHLEKHGDGVIAHFQQDRYISLTSVSGARHAFFTSESPPPYIDKTAYTFATAIPAAVGDEFNMILNPHAACSLKIAVQDGQIGVIAEGPNQPPPIGARIPYVQSDWVKFFAAK